MGREQPGADVGDHRDPEPGQVGDRYRRGEALDPEVRGVHLEHEGGALGHGRRVVLEMDPVGGAHLTEPGTHRLQEVGDPEAVADLDELATRDDDLPALGQGTRGQGHRSGAVVDHVHGPGVGHGLRQGCQRTGTAATAAAGDQIELDVGRTGGQ